MTRERKAALVCSLGALVIGAVSYVTCCVAFPASEWPKRLRGEQGVGPNIAQPPVVVRLPHRVGLTP